MLHSASSEERGDELGDLDDLLAPGRFREVELGMPAVAEREDEPHPEGVRSVVAGRLSVGPQVSEVLLEQNLGKDRLALLDERPVRLEDLPVNVGVDPDQVLVRPTGVEQDVPAP